VSPSGDIRSACEVLEKGLGRFHPGSHYPRDHLLQGLLGAKPLRSER
jgi:hypothetical protein